MDRLDEIKSWLVHWENIRRDDEWAKAMFYVGDLVGMVEAARRENTCDACAGTGKPVSGLPCICGGSGKASDAMDGLRVEVYENEYALQEALDRIKALEAELEAARREQAEMLRELDEERLRKEVAYMQLRMGVELIAKLQEERDEALELIRLISEAPGDGFDPMKEATDFLRVII